MWSAYAHRVCTAAWFWHLTHGTALSVGNYIVPVPSNWYVESQSGEGQLLVRIDTADPTPYKWLKSHASILLLPEASLRDQDLHRLLSLDTDFLKQHGVEPILQRTFDVAQCRCGRQTVG